MELLGAKLDLAKSLDEEIIEVCNVDEIGAESELAEEMNLRVLSKIRAVKDATSQDSSDKIKTTHGHETSPFTLQASTLQQPVDLENEQTLHGPGSVAGLGMEPTIQAGVSATLNQPQGTNLALPNSNDGSIRENANPSYVYPLAHQPRAKLPRLVLPKFQGDIT